MKNIKEIWRDVPGYKGYYEVSNQGRVRSLDRTIINSLGRKYFYKGRFFEDSLDVHGYKQLCLSRDGKARGFKVSQLVAMTFLKHTPNGHTLVVDHIDGDRTNDNVDNLRIVTHRNNLSSCFRKDRNTLTSDFVGVCQVKDKWQAQIQLKNKVTYLGSFDNELYAAKAYQKALAKLENGTFNPEDYKPKFLSKYKGISFQKTSQKYICQPYINGRQIYLGIHSTEEEAHQAILLHEAIQPIEKI